MLAIAPVCIEMKGPSIQSKLLVEHLLYSPGSVLSIGNTMVDTAPTIPVLIVYNLDTEPKLQISR